MQGIYVVWIDGNNRKYVGASSNIMNRIYQHRFQLKNQVHANKPLQEVYDKNGVESFKFKVLEPVSDYGVLDERLKEHFRGFDETYNLYSPLERTIRRRGKHIKTPDIEVEIPRNHVNTVWENLDSHIKNSLD